MTSGNDLHAVRVVLHKEIVTGATRSTAGVLKVPPVVNWKDARGTIPRDINTVGIPPRTTKPVRTGTRPSAPPIIIGSQKIEGPRRPIIPHEIRNTEPLNASIHIVTSKHRDPTPTWSKAIGSKFTNKSIADVSARSRMKFASDIVLSKSPNFMDLGLSYVDTTDEIGYVFAPTTRIGLATHGYDWILRRNCISEATTDRGIGTKAKNHYNFKSKFRNRREKVVDQDFGRQNDPMSRPPLDSTPLGTATANGTMLPSDSIPVEKRSPKPTSPELKTDLTGDPDLDPSLSYSPKKYNLLNDTNSSKTKRKKTQ